MNGRGAALLRAEGLNKSFGGRRVVNDVSIEVLSLTGSFTSSASA